MNRRVYVEEYIGLTNRLETLNLAFAIQQAHGHDVWLDWPELDAISVAGAHTGKPGWWRRWRALRVRHCSQEQFAALRDQPTVLLRTYLGGPDATLDALFATTLARIHVRGWVAAEIRSVLGAAADRPIVGVHLRRGDFSLSAQDRFDAATMRHPAVPLWWYEHAMARLLERDPRTMFYVSGSGTGDEIRQLAGRFPTITARTHDPYHQPGTDHVATFHPVVDLFALACCSVVLGTPVSSFTHYAANLLGPDSQCLLPALQTSRDAPLVCRIDARGARHARWSEWCRGGARHVLLAPDLREAALQPARTDWLPVAD